MINKLQIIINHNKMKIQISKNFKSYIFLFAIVLYSTLSAQTVPSTIENYIYQNVSFRSDTTQS